MLSEQKTTIQNQAHKPRCDDINKMPCLSLNILPTMGGTIFLYVPKINNIAVIHPIKFPF